MKAKKRLSAGILFLITFTIAAPFVSCSGQGKTTTGETGSVALLLIDNPTVQFDNIFVTITKVELISEATHVTIFDYPSGKEVDLLALQDESTLLSLTPDVPVGPYEKIRLHVSSVSLEKAGEPPIIPQLPGNGKIDLNPRTTFFVSPGETLILQIDFDAEKSIHLVETGKETWIFRPVVFVDILGGTLGAPKCKLLKLEGVVAEKDESGFILCMNSHGIYPSLSDSIDDSEEMCIMAMVAGTSYFDALGEPEEYDDIEAGEDVTVFALPESIFTIKSDQMYDAGVHATVVGEGSLLGLKGIIQSTLTADHTFDYEVHPNNQGIHPVDIEVLFFPGSTKIYTPCGEPLGTDAIQPLTYATVYGVFHWTEGAIYSELISVSSPPFPFKYFGNIADIDYDTKTFTLASGSENICVEADDSTTIVIGYGRNGKYEIMTDATFAEFENGFSALVIGPKDPDSGCIVADFTFGYNGETM